jgi:phosphatidylinositol alpha-1,6-mannosyltransferase
LLVVSLGVRLFRRKDTILHCGQPVATGLSGYILNRLFGIPYIVYTFGAEVYVCKKRPARGFLLGMILKRAALVITISHYTRELLLSFGCSEEKILLLTPCAEPVLEVSPEKLTEWEEKLEVPGRPVLLSVARLVKRKGHTIALQALKEIIQENPSVLYVITGDGPYRPKIEKTIWKLGLDEHVLLTGYIQDDDIRALYQLCDIFMLVPYDDFKTEDVEGFGIVYLEANMYGKPVIASSSGGILDAVQDNRSGLLVPPVDVQATAAAIVKLLNDKQLRKQLGDFGAKRAKAEFRWRDRGMALENKLKERGLL